MSLFFFITNALMGVRRHLTVALISVSVMTSDGRTFPCVSWPFVSLLLVLDGTCCTIGRSVAEIRISCVSSFL